MKRYPEYKDSGIEWIGEMPSHWDKKKLKYLVKNCIDKSNNNEEFKIALENIESNTGKFIDSNGKEFEVFSGEGKKFKKNDVLFNKLRPYLSKVYLASRDGACVGEFLVLKPLESLNSNFLFWRLLSDEFIKEINSSTYGAKMPRASWEFIGNLELPYPSKNEQKNLASYLDFKTKQIDSLILKKSKLIELLKEQWAAMIKRVVTKGLNPNAPMKNSGIEWLGKIPEHWEIKKLKYVTLSVQTGGTPASGREEYYIPGEVDWFTPIDFDDKIILNNSNRKISKLAVNESAARLFPAKSVLLVGIGATLGKVGIIEYPASSNQQINAIIFSKNFNPYFGAFYLRSIQDVLVSLSNAATLSIFNQSKTKEILIPMPSLCEQEKIVALIFEQVEKIDKVISKISNEIELLKEYKMALISEVVIGKIDVRDEK